MASITPLLTRKIEFPVRNFIFISSASVTTNAESNEVCTEFCNRNPRNLERLRIARKPSGYHLEAPGREFWHKLILDRSTRHVTAKIVHNTGFDVVTASTKEWAIKKFLYSTSDVSAYSNLGRVLAQRCLESGIMEFYCDLKPHPGGKVEAFLTSLENGGVTLSEPKRFHPHRPWHLDRPEKPWEVAE
ncbi:large ribosomal subunit protein uL18m [Periplaneta americana]|uniref:large ribosomal subunit protein uL18m n=1 Tax=Periplaneta americana TaxID=6978 RepID=UPI0037E9B0E7